MIKKYFILSLFILFLSQAMSYCEEYHIGTYNILVPSKQSSWPIRLKSMSNLILYNNFDIFGIQEGGINQLKDLEKSFDGIYSFYGVGREDGKEQGEFSAIFYKKKIFKIIEGNTFWLSETPEKSSLGWDAACKRICTWVKLLDLRNKNELYFFNTHLDHKGLKSRSESSKLILKKIEQICSKDSNIILTGDFNVNQHNPTFKSFSNSKYLKDSYSSAKYKWAPTGSYIGFSGGTFDGFLPERLSWNRLDHIFVSKSANVLRYGILNNYFFTADGKDITDVDWINPNNIKDKTIKAHIPSDHYPVSVFVEFSK